MSPPPLPLPLPLPSPPPPPLPPLTSVAVVLRHRPELRVVVCELSAFLDSRAELSMAQTCIYGSLLLLERMWAASPIATAVESTQSAVSRGEWTLRRFLRADRHYHHHQFTQCLLQAATRGDLRLAQWLFRHFSGCVANVSVVEEAAAHGHLQLLQFLWAAGRPILAARHQAEPEVPTTDRENTDGSSKRNAVEWGHRDAVHAAENHHSNVLWWLLDTVAAAEREESEMTRWALADGKAHQLQWILKLGLPEAGDNVLITSRLETLQWLFDCGYRTDESGTLTVAARHGHFELVTWLVKRGAVADAERALEAACSAGHFIIVRHLVRWGFGHEKGRALLKAVSHGHLEMAEFLYAYGFGGDLSRAMMHSAATGDLLAVEWLFNHFAGVLGANLFPEPATPAPGNRGAVMTAMDAAAMNGHVPVLSFLDRIDLRRENERQHKRQRRVVDTRKPECTTQAWNLAARNGHLQVLKWLQRHGKARDDVGILLSSAIRAGHVDVAEWLLTHTTGGESVTTPVAALDAAAIGGHIPMLEWLRDNGWAQFTTAAMDGAARRGRLRVVRWLHAQSHAGCTTAAMDGAAANGHLTVVRWLHEHRTEGCTANAMALAAMGGHFEVVLFLHSQRSEGCACGVTSSPDMPREIASWIKDKYPGA